MFSEGIVCPQVGLCMMSLPVWLPSPMCLLGGGSRVPCSLQGGLCPGVSVKEGSLSRETPQCSKERAVCILLECVLVIFNVLQGVLGPFLQIWGENGIKNRLVASCLELTPSYGKSRTTTANQKQNI